MVQEYGLAVVIPEEMIEKLELGSGEAKQTASGTLNLHSSMCARGPEINLFSGGQLTGWPWGLRWPSGGRLNRGDRRPGETLHHNRCGGNGWMDAGRPPDR